MITSYSTLLERVGHYLFGVRDGFSTDQTSDILDCIRDGLHRVYSAHDWSFLRPVVDISTEAPYAEGTVTVASGVVTLTGGVFPAWAADGIIWINNSYYSVASRDSDTQITLDRAAVTVSSSVNYQLARPEIPMDASFDSVAGDSDLNFYPGQDVWYPPIRQRHDQFIRKMEQTNPEFGRPVWYSVRTVQFDPAIGSRKVLVMYPTPDQVYMLRAPIILRPVMLDDTDEFPIGGEVLSQVFLEACLAAAEHNFEEREHVHEKRFLEMIALSIRNDQDRSSPTALGPDSPRGVSGHFSVADYDYNSRQQRIGRLTFGGDVL